MNTVNISLLTNFTPKELSKDFLENYIKFSPAQYRVDF